MRGRRFDSSLWRDPSAKFTPWVIALMGYLATLAFLLACSLMIVLEGWQGGHDARLTLELPASLTTPTQAHGSADPRLSKVLQIVGQNPAVQTFRVVSKAEAFALLKPWIGDEAHLAQLPLSTLVEITLKQYDPKTVTSLERKIREVERSAQIEDHQVWKKGLHQIAAVIEGLSFLIVAMIFLIVTCTVIFATKTSLGIHRSIVELMHIMGAKNSYIAGQFRSHTLRLGLKGGFVGLLLTALTLLLFKRCVAQLDTQWIVFPLSFWDLLGLGALIPFLLTIVMIIAAQRTALHLLKKKTP